MQHIGLAEVFDFLRDEGNRQVLSWVGGGLMAIASGVWVVVKFFLKRSAQKAARGERGGRMTVVVGRGIGIGGKAQVNIGSARVGYGLGSIFSIGLLLLVAGLCASWIVPAVARPKLPQFDFAIGCSFDGTSDAPNRLQPDERTAFADLVDFLQNHDTETIYLRARIAADCVACKCQRTDAAAIKAIDRSKVLDAGFVSIDDPQLKGHMKISSVTRDGHELDVFMPDEWATDGYFFLPRYEQLPENGLYDKGEPGTFLSYDGLFVAHYFDMTGAQGGYFEPLPNADRVQKSQLSCIRRADQMGVFERMTSGCF